MRDLIKIAHFPHLTLSSLLFRIFLYYLKSLITAFRSNVCVLYTAVPLTPRVLTRAACSPIMSRRERRGCSTPRRWLIDRLSSRSSNSRPSGHGPDRWRTLTATLRQKMCGLRRNRKVFFLFVVEIERSRLHSRSAEIPPSSVCYPGS
jgi:hypothetical protein